MNIEVNKTAFWVSVLLILASALVKADSRKMCVFDLLGANGPTFSNLKDYKAAAIAWGVDLKLMPYSSERVAAEDFKAGLCDAVSFTGIRAREFNQFTGSLDAIGALPSYAHLKAVIAALSAKKASRLMSAGPYEIAGIYPAGAAYMFVNDRTIDTVGELAGKRMAILDSDRAQYDMVNFIGASPISTSITNMYSQFNNGSVDITYGPAIVYEAMELNKGLEPNGGIIRFSLAQLTMQLVIRSQAFPQGYGQKSREYALTQFDSLKDIVNRYERNIPKKYWVDLPEQDKVGYREVFRQSRIRLRDKGVYNAKMLKLMRITRCKLQPELSECSAKDKE